MVANKRVEGYVIRRNFELEMNSRIFSPAVNQDFRYFILVYRVIGSVTGIAEEVVFVVGGEGRNRSG